MHIFVWSLLDYSMFSLSPHTPLRPQLWGMMRQRQHMTLANLETEWAVRVLAYLARFVMFPLRRL